jgi:hypothetical protein
MPVHTIGDVHSLIAARSAARDSDGLGLRYMPAQTALAGAASLREAVAREVERLETTPEAIDLLVDLGWLDPNRPISAEELAPVLRTLRVVGRWRSIALLGTSVPSTLGSFPEGSLSGFFRREFALWSELRQRGLVDLDFGDHGIQNPKPPDLRNAQYMRASIRFTIDDATLVARGNGPVLDLPVRERFAQYRRLSQLLFEHPKFPLDDCCEAERIIQLCADDKRNIQAQHAWRGVTTLHHATLVTTMLNNVDAVGRTSPKLRHPTPTRV